MAAKHPVKRPATAREIAEKFGVHPTTVRRFMAQPRAQWLAENSISRERPWARLGISRATWYRRGKPDPDRVLAPPSGYSPE